METKPTMKIMLIEDDPSMQSLLRTLLDLEGFKVIAPSSSKNEDELLAIVRAEAPDVLLLDVHLKEMNGVDILKRLRQDSTTAATRVIMTSGMDVESQCMQAGADGFLLKPYMPSELIRRLRQQPPENH
jgi:DNA-binding response OmpR family regulator